MAERGHSMRVILHSVISFLMFLALLIIVNVLVSYIHNAAYERFVLFMNSLLGLFIVIFIVGMINGIFWNLEFPLNLLAPLSGGSLGVLIVMLIRKMLEFTQGIVYFGAIDNLLSYNIYSLVFLAVVIIGYLLIISEERRKLEGYSGGRIGRDERIDNLKKRINDKVERTDRELKNNKKKKNSKNSTWGEVGDEFRSVLLNIGKAMNGLFEKKDKKKPKRKK